MPFELGIDYGLRKSGNTSLNTKQFLILEANRYDYMKAISDINGFDIKVHSNDTEKMQRNKKKYMHLYFAASLTPLRPLRENH